MKIPWTVNTHFKTMKGRRVKQVYSRGGYQWERLGTRKMGMRGNMADVFCIHT
jgi:hypothetical protein